MSSNSMALAIFVGAYLLFIFFPHRRPLVAVCGSLLLVLTGVISYREAFLAVNWNVMGIFVGTLVVADLFMESRVPAYLAELIVNRAKNIAWAMVLICTLAGIISAFVENVATLLIIAPIALALARKLNIAPTTMMIAIAMSSNLQGAATLIGDPPSMLLAGFARMNFMDFFFYEGKPSIFFAVELGALATLPVLYFFFRHHREKMELVPMEIVQSWVPTLILVLLILALALSSFFDTGISNLAGIICIVFALITLCWGKLARKTSLLRGITSLDWDTTFFLIGVFILVGSITLTGWIEVISQSLSHLVAGKVFWGYTILVLIAIGVSAFVDNVPFFAAMLPVALSLAERMDLPPSLFLFGLLIGASLGGNITPIGASANIVACGLLNKEGYKVSFATFVKMGIPFTLAAVLPAYLFVWWVWR